MSSDLHAPGPVPPLVAAGVPARYHAPVRGAAHRRPARWERRYAAVVATTDLLSVVAAVVVGLLVGYAESFADVRVVGVVATVTVTGLGAALWLGNAWDSRVLGQGSEEFNRLLRAIVISAVLLALVGLAVSAPGTRPWVFLVIPSAGALAAAGRLVARRSVHRQRRNGRCLHPVLAVGDDAAIADLVGRTRRDVHHGWVVAGACTPSGAAADGGTTVADVPIVGDLDGLARTVLDGGYRVVAVAPSPGWSAERLRRLAWDLEGTPVELVVQPGLMEVAGPRLHVSPVDGLPLLRLTQPAFTGFPRVLKTVIDRVAAALLLCLVAPLLVGIAVAVALDGGRPLFRQTRVGRNGTHFTMIKFRSMVVDAEVHLSALTAANEAAGPLFKMRRDPRVTPIGRWLRRYSLDELPQLLNVLTGSMSLVGPRPPLPHEVASYSPDAMRRLLVRPGLTGLWQVSGRSDLSWEETIRLDLRYVENWNLALDAMILWKTIGTVTRPAGAY